MTSPRSPDTAHGKAFEKAIHEAVRNLNATLPIMWERVIDSHDAGNLIRNADCDFKLTVKSSSPGRPWVFHIECKASVKFPSLASNGARRSLIKGDQIGKMRLCERAGAHGIFLFLDVRAGVVEVWDAPAVIEAWGKKRYNWVAQPSQRFRLEQATEWFKRFICNLRYSE